MANNFNLSSAQPVIVDDQKGLAINFQLIGTKVDGTQQTTPSLTANFGDIGPGQTGTAQFLMTSTLQGKFVAYSASFSHDDFLGGQSTSLIDSVQVHQLIHVAQVGYVGNPSNAPVADDGIPDFLVNDIPDPQSLPDTLYLSDGSVQPVNDVSAADVSSITQDPSNPLEYHVSANLAAGWDYLQFADPGNGLRLSEVDRSDGLKLRVGDNVWTTDRTFATDSNAVTYENLVHLLDFGGSDSGTMSYTLIYTRTDTTTPDIQTLQLVKPSTRSTPVATLDVTFVKPINVNTLVGALTLTRTDTGGTPTPVPLDGTVTAALVPGTTATYRISGLAQFTQADGTYRLIVDSHNVFDPSGNNGTNAATDEWTMDTADATVQVMDVAPTPRNQPVSTVDVFFSQPITASTFQDSALTLTDNGGPNLISPAVVITPADQPGDVPGTHYQITGLHDLTTSDGDYRLTVDATGITDTHGDPAAGVDFTSWTMDTVAPTITNLEQVATNPRNIVVQTLDVTFSTPIDPATFDRHDLTLTRTDANGTSANLISDTLPAGQLVTIAPVPGTASTYRISNINWVVGLNGTYTLTVNGSGIQDLAGNAVSNSASTSWVMNTTPPPPPAALGITPSTGFALANGITYTGTVTFSGVIPDATLRVHLFDLTTNTDLGDAFVNGPTSSNVVKPGLKPADSGATFSRSLQLSPGTHKLEAQAIDGANNYSTPSTLNIFVDVTPPTASLAPIASPQGGPVVGENVTFSKAIDPTTFDVSDLTLTLNGGANLLAGASGITIALVDGTTATYRISGLDTLTAAPGTYTLTVNAATVQDLGGNFGTGTSTVTWRTAAADLALSMTVDHAASSQGGTVQYTITVDDNNGPEAASGVQVTDLLPSGLTFVSATPSTGTYSSATGVWAVGSLPVTSSATLQITATVNGSTVAGTITNTARITAADQLDPNSANNSASQAIAVQAHLDFTAPYNLGNPGPVSPTQPGYQRVDQAQTFDGSYGWQSPAVSFDRDSTQLQQPAAGVPNYLDLLQAGDYGNQGTFEVSLPNGSYAVTLTVGDGALAHNNITAAANGAPVTFTLGDGRTVSTLSSPSHQFLTASFTVTISDGVGGANGLLQLTLNKDANYAYDSWVLSGLDIRLADSVNTITLTARAPDQNGLVTVSGSGATPNSLVTVGASLGTITTTDREGNYAGTQVVADSGGNFTYTVRETTPGNATFSTRRWTAPPSAARPRPWCRPCTSSSAPTSMPTVAATAPARRRRSLTPTWCPRPTALRWATAGWARPRPTTTAAPRRWPPPTSSRSWKPSTTAQTTPSRCSCWVVKLIPST